MQGNKASKKQRVTEYGIIRNRIITNEREAKRVNQVSSILRLTLHLDFCRLKSTGEHGAGRVFRK